MGKTHHVEDSVIDTEIGLFPAIGAHIDGIDRIAIKIFGYISFKTGTDIAIGAGNKYLLHSLRLYPS